ncbi:glycosyltransferase family 2 protein [Colwelliaceae bacterium MEBiC 14330]
MNIDIVLATFNGELYLEEQIKSIQNNSVYKECVARVIVVDDGSTDKTAEIVHWLARSDAKIEWLLNTSGKHGPSSNFAFGLAQTTSQYIMLSDQDDIWHPEKIALSIAKITQLADEKAIHQEKKAQAKTNNTPLLVFSDKEIVDEKLQLISKSYFELKNIPPNWYLSFDQLCQQNIISGCTMCFNRALLDKAMPIPQQAYMHDWWLALVASRCGKIALIEKPLIKYRQHANNSIGAQKRSKLSLFSKFFHYLNKFEQNFYAVTEQAKAFSTFEKNNNIKPNQTINALSKIEQLSRYNRLALFVKKVITRSNFSGRMGLLIVLIKIKIKNGTEAK